MERQDARKMLNWKYVIPLVIAIATMAILMCGCSGDSMKSSEKLNDGKLDLENAADIYEMEDESRTLTDASVELFKNTCDTTDNSMISPYSIIQAVAVCSNGARGDTLKQIENAFGLGIDKLNEWSLAYAGRLESYEDGSPLDNANAVWFRKEGFTSDEEFLKRASSFYGAEAYSSAMDADTVDDINGWVSNKTRGKIDKLVSDIDSNTNAVIVNAVYFNDNWADPYDEDAVADGTFTTEDGRKLDVRMMSSDENQYIEGSNFTGFRKYYENAASFVALLPSEGTTVNELVKSLDGESFRSALDNSSFGTVHTKLPEFKSEYTANKVLEALNTMGISDLFSREKADLSGMGESDLGNLFIGDVVHKTFIDVNEEGTEAAAATGMIAMSAMAPPEEEYYVYLDRPFVYAIVDDATGVPLFIGTCMGIE